MTVYSSAKQFLSWGVEATQGTAVATTWSAPIDKFEPEDKVVWLDDKALRASMVELYGRQTGPQHAEFSMSGPWFGDGGGYLLANILGDVVESGTYTGSGTTTSTASSAVGATTITTHASTGTGLVQIDTGTLSEIRNVTSVTGGSDPFTLHFTTGLAYAHNSGVTVKPVTTPYSHAISVLNTATAQPTSLTLVHWQGLPATTQARTYPGACLSELTLKGNAESTLITCDAKGMAYPSSDTSGGSPPTPSFTSTAPIAAWKSTVGLAGPASGGTQVRTIGEWEVTIKRQLAIIFTAQNLNTPYVIQRGAVSVSGKFMFSAPGDETPLTYMLNNTQPQFQMVVSNGSSGANLISLQIDMQNASFATSKINTGKEQIAYDVTFDGVSNTTNSGGSGGYSPIKLTLQDAVTPNAITGSGS